MNMSYCRFENTVQDLQDCYDNLLDDLSEREARARRQLIELCRDIINEWEAYEEEKDAGGCRNGKD